MRKQLLLGFAAVAVMGAVPGCTTVVEEDRKPVTHTTTTTESTSVHRPASTATETTTYRSY
jgi:hypothetical protein